MSSRKVDSIDLPKDPKHENWLIEWSNIHNKCIFDAVNDALDYYRPYSLNGPPLPWSNKIKELTYKHGSSNALQDVLLGVKSKVLSWAIMNAGMMKLPERVKSNEIIQRSNREKEILERLREEKLEIIKNKEVKFYVEIDYGIRSNVVRL